MTPTAVVTGAAGGIGRATVLALAEQGWNVAAADRSPASGWPDGVTFYQVDVSQEGQVAGLFEAAAERFGSLAGLVNNAAEQIARPVSEMSVDEWDRILASNLRSAFLTCRAAFPLLGQAGGAVVNVASVHALATSADIAAYAASKGGLVAFTRALAIEFAAQGVRVNAVLPGAVDTPMLAEGLRRVGGPDGESEARRRLISRTPLGRIGTPGEISRAIAFLLDPRAASFITGQTLVVDGGATARLATE